MRRMTVDLTDETLERIKEIQKVYDVDIDVIVAVAIKSFYDTQRESTLLDVLDSRETLDR
jgi:predicted transcriptional regulator